MSSAEVYLRPLFVSELASDDAGTWGRLAGGRLRFSHVEVIERASLKRQTLTYGDTAASG